MTKMDKVYTIFGCIGIAVVIGVILYLIISGDIFYYLSK